MITSRSLFCDRKCDAEFLCGFCKDLDSGKDYVRSSSYKQNGSFFCQEIDRETGYLDELTHQRRDESISSNYVENVSFKTPLVTVGRYYVSEPFANTPHSAYISRESYSFLNRM